MQTIHLTATFDIPAEHRARFRELQAELISKVRENEPGALQYLWFYNAEGSQCQVREIYAGVAAVKAHADNAGSLLGEMVKISKLSVQFYGAPSSELSAITEFLGASLFEYSDGLDRLIPA